MSKYVGETGLKTLKAIFDSTVRTVNGVSPDTSGNVDLSESEIDSSMGYKHAELTEAVALPSLMATEVLSLTLEPGYLWLVCGSLTAVPASSAENEVFVSLAADGVSQARETIYCVNTRYRSASLCCVISTLSQEVDTALTLTANPRTRYNTTLASDAAAHACLSAVRLTSKTDA